MPTSPNAASSSPLPSETNSSPFTPPLSARHLFDEISDPDLISFSALISSYTRNSLGHAALQSFLKMLFLGLPFNHFTSLLHLLVLPCRRPNPRPCRHHRSRIRRLRRQHPLLTDSLKLFEEMTQRNLVSWNALLNGYVKNGCFCDAMRLFGGMVSSGIRPNEFGLSTAVNACTGSKDLWPGEGGSWIPANVLVDMYAKLGEIQEATVVFEGMARHDVVSWNVCIACSVLNGEDRQAI